jgi:hypothetical protein
VGKTLIGQIIVHHWKYHHTYDDISKACSKISQDIFSEWMQIFFAVPGEAWQALCFTRAIAGDFAREGDF